MGNYRLPYWISQMLLTDILQQNRDGRLISLGPMIEEFSGALFDVVFKRSADDDMIVSKRPDMTKVKPSAPGMWRCPITSRVKICSRSDRSDILR